LHLIWMSRPSSKLFKFSLCLSSRIMLQINMFAMRMSKMIFWSYSQNGFTMTWKQWLVAPQMQVSCPPYKIFVQWQNDIFFPFGVCEWFAQNGWMWMYSINKWMILNILIAIDHDCDIWPNTL
jgi:hypothetical protein